MDKGRRNFFFAQGRPTATARRWCYLYNHIDIFFIFIFIFIHVARAPGSSDEESPNSLKLSNNRYLTVSEFKNKVDIRVYYRNDEDGEQKPGKKAPVYRRMNGKKLYPTWIWWKKRLKIKVIQIQNEWIHEWQIVSLFCNHYINNNIWKSFNKVFIHFYVFNKYFKDMNWLPKQGHVLSICLLPRICSPNQCYQSLLMLEIFMMDISTHIFEFSFWTLSPLTF